MTSWRATDAGLLLLICVPIFTASCGGFLSIADDNACLVSGDCPSGSICVGFACAPVCNSDADCTGGTSCIEGACLINECGNGEVSTIEECDNGADNADTAACTAACKTAVCGDGLIQEGVEACDSAGVETADCNLDCTVAMCGDGKVNAAASEECDDANADNADGCTDACRASMCGNGTVETSEGEVCDDGTNDGVYGCATDCKSLAGSFCGDGTLDSDFGETCDLGTGSNAGGYNGCNADCTLGPRCGDGVLSTADGEACDLGTALNTGAYNTCNINCTLPARCGDSNVDTAEGEVCDDGVNNGTYGCSPDCKSPAAAFCGDGAVEAGVEECDDGTASNTGAYNGCNANCTFASRCGDAVVDAGNGEACDLGTASNTGAYNGCNANCTLASPRCGDGTVNSSEGEFCDDGDANNGNIGCCQSDCLGIAATALYVSPSGDDSNDGSMGSPLQTLGAALGKTGDCDKIIILPGTYDCCPDPPGPTGPSPLPLPPGGILLGDPDNKGQGTTAITIQNSAGQSCGVITQAAVVASEGSKIEGVVFDVFQSGVQTAAVVGVNSNVTIRKNTFESGTVGVCMNPGLGSLIEENCFGDDASTNPLQYGVRLAASGNQVTIRNNDFRTSAMGVQITFVGETLGSTVIGNTFGKRASVGFLFKAIELQGSATRIENNTFEDVRYLLGAAITVTDATSAAPVFRGNTFTLTENATAGIWISSAQSADLGTNADPGNNNFSGVTYAAGSTAAVRHSQNITIEARGNVWPAASPVCGQGNDIWVDGSGQVDWGSPGSCP